MANKKQIEAVNSEKLINIINRYQGTPHVNGLKRLLGQVRILGTLMIDFGENQDPGWVWVFRKMNGEPITVQDRVLIDTWLLIVNPGYYKYEIVTAGIAKVTIFKNIGD